MFKLILKFLDDEYTFGTYRSRDDAIVAKNNFQKKTWN